MQGVVTLAVSCAAIAMTNETTNWQIENMTGVTPVSMYYAFLLIITTLSNVGFFCPLLITLH